MTILDFWEPFHELGLVGYLVYFNELIFGYSRLAFYANIIISIALGLNPKTLIAAIYFLIQIPFDFFFLFMIYPFYPELDVPYFRWDFTISEILDI